MTLRAEGQLSPCTTAIVSVLQSLGAATTEPTPPRAFLPQQEKPEFRTPLLEKNLTQQRGPSRAKNKIQ